MGSTDGGEVGARPPSPEPTVLVTGSAGGSLSSVALQLLKARIGPADGIVLVVFETSPARLIQRLTAGPRGIDRDALVVVDCRRTAEPGEAETGRVRRVQPGGSHLAVDRAVLDGLDWLAAHEIERRHFLFDSLAVGEWLPDSDAVYHLAYELAMTVGAEDGLGAFVVESAGLPTDDIDRLGHLFDVRLELKRDEGTSQVRWTGLLGGSDGWLPTEQVDFRAADFG